MQRTNWMQRLTPIGLILTLLVLSAHAIGFSWYTHRQDTLAAHAALVNQDFQRARYLMELEDQLEMKYRSDHDANLLTKFQTTSQELTRSLQQLAALTSGTDQQAIQRMIQEHTNYLNNAQQLFSAIQAGAADATIAVIDAQDDWVAADMAQTTGALADKYQALATERITSLEDLQQRAFESSPIVFLFGSFLILLMWRMVTQSQKFLEEAHKREIARLEQSALTDSLTGLGNHRAYQEDIRRELARSLAHNLPLSLALIDIDDFKSLNDERGHAFGDQVLQAVGKALGGLSTEVCAYRLGGDEFALLMPHAGAEMSADLMRQLHDNTADSLYGATVSVGVTTRVLGLSDAADLKEQADAALYEAKRRGRNCSVTFAAIQHAVTIFTNEKIHALRTLLKEQRIGVAFQPIWDVQGKRLLGVEALSRPAQDYQFKSPLEAFDVAERMGYETELDSLCRTTILANATALPDDVLLFMNVCPQSLEVGQLDERLFLAQIQAAGLRPQRIVIEVTERAFKRLDAVVEAVQRLRALGFGIALDDVGSGNSGLELMSHLAADYVKIDRGILVNAMTDQAARGVLAGIVAIARETNGYVIAEGIENQAMLDLVRSLSAPRQRNQGVHGVQGYLFGRPSAEIPVLLPEALQRYAPRAA